MCVGVKVDMTRISEVSGRGNILSCKQEAESNSLFIWEAHGQWQYSIRIQILQ